MYYLPSFEMVSLIWLEVSVYRPTYRSANIFKICIMPHLEQIYLYACTVWYCADILPGLHCTQNAYNGSYYRRHSVTNSIQILCLSILLQNLKMYVRLLLFMGTKINYSGSTDQNLQNSRNNRNNISVDPTRACAKGWLKVPHNITIILSKCIDADQQNAICLQTKPNWM